MALSVVIFFLKYQKKMLEKEQKELEIEVKFQQNKRLQEQDHQRQLLEAILWAQEKEQRRIAADLHDELGPTLALIKMQARSIMKYSEQKEELITISNSLQEGLTEAISNVRRITHDLLPAAIDDLGLLAVLNSLESTFLTASDIRFYFKSDLQTKLPIEKKHEIILYRIIQELIHNSIKHAEPSEIHLTIFVEEKNIQLVYKDNGIGFSSDKLVTSHSGTNGLGMRNLEGRISVLNGTYMIKSAKGEGFCILIKIPIDDRLT